MSLESGLVRQGKSSNTGREGEYVLRAEMPGVDRKDLDISLTETAVTIKGSRRSEHKEEKGDYQRCEISTGGFSRTVSLPGEVDADKAKATFNDGMLELSLPKVKAARRRKVEIQ